MEEEILKSDFFQKELDRYGLKDERVSLIREKDGVIVARVWMNRKTAILKCFENADFRREIENYDILRNLEIPTIKVFGKSDRSILLEDLTASDEYRLGEEEDLHDPEVIKAIAGWYKILHQNGCKYVQEHGNGMYEEWDLFTLKNIKTVSERFGLRENDAVKDLLASYPLLRAKLDCVPRTLTYNDFYYTNLAVRKDKSQALMFDFNLLGKGSYISDINNVTYWFNEKENELFYSVYGEADEELVLLDRICSPIISLYSAMKRDIFPDWAAEEMNALEEIPSLLLKLFDEN
jgi:hypothetical protein